jgi:hypothetical protein
MLHYGLSVNGSGWVDSISGRAMCIVFHREKSKYLSDEDVRFHWCITAADFGEAEEKIPKDMITDLWIAIHGFSFVVAGLSSISSQIRTCRNLMLCIAVINEVSCQCTKLTSLTFHV